MSYQGMSGLELFGDPFSHNSYSQATQTRTMATQSKTQIQQPRIQVPATQPEPQVQQPQPPTQAQIPVTQHNPITPEPEPVTSVPTEKTTPVDTKPEPPKKELVMDMSSGSATDSKATEDDTAKRKAHEELEAKRKAEWEEKQLAKKQAEEAAIQKLQSMSDDDIIAASIERVSTDVERITRRNMKECVSEYIQSLARKDASFARKTMHPRKNMVNCFRFINRKAKEFIEQEMKDNDVKLENGIYGTSVPDNIVYQWSETYFFETDVPEDQEKEEKFVPKPYVGTTSKTSSKPKKATTSKAKKTEKPATKEAKKKQESSSGYEQMSFV